MAANAGTLRFWKPRRLEGVDLLYGTDITHYYPPHLHEEYCIQLVFRGLERTIYRGKNYDAYPGDLALMNAEEVHSTESRRTKYTVIKIKPQTVRRIAEEAGGKGVFG